MTGRAMSGYVLEPCEFGDALGRHRWRVRDTGHRTPEQNIIWDDWCQRCGLFRTDVTHPKGGYPSLRKRA